ncbi:MAG: DNA repair protein RecO [Proteobacteria bacterium]|nr:DNA repair protein RecO [Pseudomonadota bacterium]
MPSFASPAIMLRRIDYGDYDLIITFFTLKNGKTSVIAKSAKKSTKRFSGILELFSVLDIVCSTGRRGKALFVLQEATLKHPFPGIRSDIIQTAYASYWAEVINEWMENGQEQKEIYYLFEHVLSELDLGRIPAGALSILFQMRFMTILGFQPNLSCCCVCQKEIAYIKENNFAFDLAKGGLVCHGCEPVTLKKIYLSKGTVKQLQWIKCGDFSRAMRMKLSSQAIVEGLAFMEAFVPYHLEKDLRSLKFLKQMENYQVS